MRREDVDGSQSGWRIGAALLQWLQWDLADDTQ
jgi:hypothetical protein